MLARQSLCYIRSHTQRCGISSIHLTIKTLRTQPVATCTIYQPLCTVDIETNRKSMNSSESKTSKLTPSKSSNPSIAPQESVTVHHRARKKRWATESASKRSKARRAPELSIVIVKRDDENPVPQSKSQAKEE